MRKPHLSYANVVATLALFIALGTGGAYAASKINGATIKDRSIPASKIKKGSLTATEVREAAGLKQLVFSKGKKRAKARDASSSSTASSGIVRLNLGESATLLQSGPFTLTVKCTLGEDQDGSNAVGKPTTSIIGTTTEAHTLVSGFDAATGGMLDILEPGEDGILLGPGNNRPLNTTGAEPIMIAPSGAQLNARFFYGNAALGADCYASAWGVAG